MLQRIRSKHILTAVLQWKLKLPLFPRQRKSVSVSYFPRIRGNSSNSGLQLTPWGYSSNSYPRGSLTQRSSSDHFIHKSHITLQSSSNNKNVFSSFNDTDRLRFAPFDMLFSKFPTDPRIIIGYFPPFIKRPQNFFLKFCNQEFLINHEYFVQQNR